MAKERLLLTLSPGLRARIDAARGETPRTQWIERAIEQALGGQTVSEVAPRRTDPPAPAESLSPIERERARRDAFSRAYRPPKRSGRGRETE